MSPLISAIISGLIIAILTGSTIFAIKYHDVFDEISTKIMTILFFIFACLSGFLLGYDAGLKELSTFIAKQHSSIYIPEPKYHTSYYYWLFSIYIVTQTYLFAIDYLGRKIKENKNQKQK